LLGDIAVRLTGGACPRLWGIIACLQPASSRAGRRTGRRIGRRPRL